MNLTSPQRATLADELMEEMEAELEEAEENQEDSYLDRLGVPEDDEIIGYASDYNFGVTSIHLDGDGDDTNLILHSDTAGTGFQQYTMEDIQDSIVEELGGEIRALREDNADLRLRLDREIGIRKHQTKRMEELEEAIETLIDLQMRQDDINKKLCKRIEWLDGD